ncbi:unnamed protein product [marine sediment metagenome]|uniref:Uncharacterized protein n=1 Tax=marine sediment metagenome TaxID=412755 RepID=X0VE42_9ZZZZ
MDSIKLKLIAGAVVVESRLTKPAKIQLLNWLQKEATDIQVKSFLLDQKIININPQAEKIINDRFNGLPLNEEFVLAAIIIAGAVTAGYKAYQYYASQAAKACQGSKNKTLCMVEYKIKGEKARIEKLASEMKKCQNTKNPVSCRNQVQVQINKSKARIEKLQSKRIKKL